MQCILFQHYSNVGTRESVKTFCKVKPPTLIVIHMSYLSHLICIQGPTVKIDQCHFYSWVDSGHG